MTVDAHFVNRDPDVLATYQRLLKAARALGPVVEDPKKTSIHLVRDTAFAGVATNRSSLIVTLKATKDIRSRRVRRRLQASARRWYLYIRLDKPADVDDQLTKWLRDSYALSGE